MPVATHKVTWFFEGKGRGWTESLWFGSNNGAYEQTMGAAKTLAAERAEMLGKECWIKAIRVSTEGTGPDAMLRYVDFRQKGDVAGKIGNAIQLKKGTAQPDVALLIRFENITQDRHKFVFMRGIWDEVENNHGVYTPTDDWKKAVGNWAGSVRLGAWGWWGVQEKKKERLTGITRNANDSATFTFANNMFAGITVGKRVSVRISGVNKGRSNLNATHIVQVKSASEAVTEGVLAISNNNLGGFGAIQTKGFTDIEFYDDQKIVTRECGAPLLESPGRQKAKARG